jgi:AcrR family transcriptional regulator
MVRSAEPVNKVAPEPESLPPSQRERRDRIVRAAIELLQDREYEQIQIRDVADRADVALATLYRYFTSKEHLYAAALLEWSTSFGLKPGQAGDLDSDAERLRYLLLKTVRSVGRRPQLLRAEMVLENSPDPNAQALFEKFAERHVGVLTDALHDVDPDTAEAIVEATVCVLDARLRSWARGRCTIKDVERSVSRAVDLVLG